MRTPRTPIPRGTVSALNEIRRQHHSSRSKLISLHDAAKILNVSYSTVYRYREQLGTVRMGQFALRVPKSTVLKAVASGFPSPE